MYDGAGPSPPVNIVAVDVPSDSPAALPVLIAVEFVQEVPSQVSTFVKPPLPPTAMAAVEVPAPATFDLVP